MSAATTGVARPGATTPALSAFIAPFLLVAFVILYGFPGETARLWSWQIQSHMTSMLLASAYLGGCYFFLRVLLVERRWAEVRAGFVSVALFASLLGVATVMHWDKFSHDKVAFWLWAGLYFTAPFLVVAAWLANQRYAAPPLPTRLASGAWPGGSWPARGGRARDRAGPLRRTSPGDHGLAWPLTPLTSRVVGATSASAAPASRCW